MKTPSEFDPPGGFVNDSSEFNPPGGFVNDSLSLLAIENFVLIST